jgi:hypothetical protein
MTIEEELRVELRQKFPGARGGFIDVLVEALALHEKKNHDYNGIAPLFPATSNMLFHDIRRKFGRLYTQMENGESYKINESLLDTVIDLGNYSFLLAEKLKYEDQQ